MTDYKSLTDDGFRGNILIVREGAVLYESSTGFADLANVMGGMIGGTPVLYLGEGENRVALEKTGNVGE